MWGYYLKFEEYVAKMKVLTEIRSPRSVNRIIKPIHVGIY